MGALDTDCDTHVCWFREMRTSQNFVGHGEVAILPVTYVVAFPQLVGPFTAPVHALPEVKNGAGSFLKLNYGEAQDHDYRSACGKC